jgi:hypothetical protein
VEYAAQVKLPMAVAKMDRLTARLIITPDECSVDEHNGAII